MTSTAEVDDAAQVADALADGGAAMVADTAEVGDAAQVAHATIFDDATTGLLCEYPLWLPRLCDRVNVLWHTSHL